MMNGALENRRPFSTKRRFKRDAVNTYGFDRVVLMLAEGGPPNNGRGNAQQ